VMFRDVRLASKQNKRRGRRKQNCTCIRIVSLSPNAVRRRSFPRRAEENFLRSIHANRTRKVDAHLSGVAQVDHYFDINEDARAETNKKERHARIYRCGAQTAVATRGALHDSQ